MNSRVLLAGLLFLGGLFRTAGAQIDWPTLQLTPVAAVSLPTTITHAGDGSGRLFVTEKDGTIRIIKGTEVLGEAFLDLAGKITRDGEQGLLGLAFAPGFAVNGCFYVNYTREPDGATVVSRFRVSETNADVALPASEEVLLVIPSPYGNHRGGCMAFGPDGYLYLSTGDGGGDPGDRPQDKQSLLGKILRIDVSSSTNGYAVPPSNPFYNDPACSPEIWSLGLRNPWRFSFDRLTGDLYVSDVGSFRDEEINFQPASSLGGENYGWPAIEGKVDNALPPGFDVGSMMAPIWSYGPGPGLAIIGGNVYRGTRFPRMQGAYYFADFTVPGVWALRFDGNRWQRGKVSHAGGALTMGEGEDGELYLGQWDQIVRLEDRQACYPPRFDWPSAFADSIPVSCLTPDARIHYTTEERDPTEEDPSIASGETVPMAAKVWMRAFRAGLNPSETVSQSFDVLRVAPPVFEQRLGPSNTMVVTISSLTPGAAIYYTTNGAGATEADLAYDQPFDIPIGTPVNAAAFKDSYVESPGVDMLWATITSVAIIDGSLQVTVLRGNPWSFLSLETSVDLKVWRTHGSVDVGGAFTTFIYSGYSTNVKQSLFFRAVQQLSSPQPDL